MAMIKADKIWFNGELVNWEDAKASLAARRRRTSWRTGGASAPVTSPEPTEVMSVTAASPRRNCDRTLSAGNCGSHERRRFW